MFVDGGPNGGGSVNSGLSGNSLLENCPEGRGPLKSGPCGTLENGCSNNGPSKNCPNGHGPFENCPKGSGPFDGLPGCGPLRNAPSGSGDPLENGGLLETSVGWGSLKGGRESSGRGPSRGCDFSGGDFLVGSVVAKSS